MRWLLSVAGRFFDWWNNDYLSVKLTSIYILLLSVICFLIGGYRPQTAYRVLEQDLSDAKQEIRLFAGEITRRNSLLNNIRARENINNKTIDLLSRKIENLETDNMRLREKISFYQHLLSTPPADDSIVIYALEINPNFSRQGWDINAIFSRPGKRKTFQGSYYIEVIETNEDGTHTVTRLPAEGGTEFKMDFYHEINDFLDLSPDATIQNIRIVILDKKGEEITAAEIGNENDAKEEQELSVEL